MSAITAGDSLSDIEMLRLHVAAGWGVRVPELSPDAELLPGGSTPSWALYVAEVRGNRWRIWRRGVDPAQRDALLARAHAALDLPADAPAAPGVAREVALRMSAAPALDPASASQVARLVVPEDRALVEAFEPGESAYYLDEPAHFPVFGAFAGNRLVSVAHSSRRTDAACELGVDTLPDARRAGYGLAVTVLWARAVAAEGLIPIYSALATNTASLALAAAAGYRPFARAAHVE